MSEKYYRYLLLFFGRVGRQTPLSEGSHILNYSQFQGGRFAYCDRAFGDRSPAQNNLTNAETIRYDNRSRFEVFLPTCIETSIVPIRPVTSQA